MYSILADIVVCIHFAFVFFVVFGGLIYYLWRNCPYLHIPAVFWGFWVELSGSVCPLTPLADVFPFPERMPLPTLIFLIFTFDVVFNDVIILFFQ